MRNYFSYLLITASCLIAMVADAQTVTDPSQQLYIRRQQLSGTFNKNYSFSQRYLLAGQTNFDQIIQDFSFGDRIVHNIEGTKILDTTKQKIRLLPLSKWDVYNTHHPITINDAEMIPSVGYQTVISTGIFYERGHITAQFKPSFVFTENKPYETFYTEHNAIHWRDYYQWINKIDMPERFGTSPINRIAPGQSFIKYNFKNSSVGISTENRWWGPGYYQSLLLTNNAPGFLHLAYESKKPMKTIFGSIEWQAITGVLENSHIEPLEPRRVYYGTTLYVPKPDKQRMFTGLTVTVQPKFLDGLFVGFAKTAYMYTQEAKSPLDYLPLFGFYGVNTTQLEKNKRKQMMGSLFVRYLMQKEHAEFYAEFGRNDQTLNPLFLMANTTVPTAFVAGFRKLFPQKNGANLEFGMELTQLSFNNAKLIFDAKSWYLGDSVKQGYTNRGKVMGSGLGPGGNSQLLEVAYNKGINRVALVVERRIHNNDFFYYTFERIKDWRRHWVDAIATLKVDHHYKNFLFGGSFTAMRSNNYQWWYKEYDPVINPSTYYKNGLDFMTLQGQVYFHYRFNLK